MEGFIIAIAAVVLFCLFLGWGWLSKNATARRMHFRVEEFLKALQVHLPSLQQDRSRTNEQLEAVLEGFVRFNKAKNEDMGGAGLRRLAIFFYIRFPETVSSCNRVFSQFVRLAVDRKLMHGGLIAFNCPNWRSFVLVEELLGEWGFDEHGRWALSEEEKLEFSQLRAAIRENRRVREILFLMGNKDSV